MSSPRGFELGGIGVIGTAEELRLLRGRVGEGARGEIWDRIGDGGELCMDGALLKRWRNVNGNRDLSGG